MVRGGMFIGALLVAAAGAAPLAAQSSDAERFQPAFSPEDDLDCAMYIGALMAEGEAELTPDNRAGLTSAFTYFVGRYEAQRGLNLTQAFTDRYPIYRQRNPAEIAQTCSVRMRAFSVRLQEAGRALTRLQPIEPRAYDAPEGEPETGE